MISSLSHPNQIRSLLLILAVSCWLLVLPQMFGAGTPVAARVDSSLNHKTVDPETRGSAGSLLGPKERGSFLLEPFAQGSPTITATKAVDVHTQAHLGDTLTYTVVISNTGSADATSVNFSDMIDPNTTLVPGSLAISPIAVDDTYNTIGNVDISVPVGTGLIANDFNPGGMGTLTVTQVNGSAVPGTVATTHGSVTMNADGSFTYNPTAGFTGTDSFTYTLGNGSGKTDAATVNITSSGRIWFVNSAAATNGDGRLASPFNILTGAGSADSVDGANDVIFLYSSATNYVGGLTLNSGEKILGQGASQSILTITGFPTPSGPNLLPSTGGSNPTIISSSAGVTLGSNNELWGATFGNTTGAAISGTSFGTLKVRDTAKNGTGQAMNLSTGTLDAIFQSISSTSSAAAGMSVNATAGSLSVTGTTSITNSSGAAVSLTSNTGTIAFSTLNITNTTSNQAGIVATENSNTITATSGAINTGSGQAINISKTSGTTPLNISLVSVSSSGGTNDGISLSNTSGSFTVNGDGANVAVGGNGSGGTIANKSGADGSITSGIGIFLNSATNVVLRRMTINGTNQNYGIRGFNVNNFTLEYATIAGTNGTVVSPGSPNSAGEGSVCFGNDNTTGMTGTGTVTNCVISGGRSNNMLVQNSSGTLNRLTIAGTTFGLNQTGVDASNAVANQSLLVEARTGTNPVLNATVTGCTFSGSPSDLANFSGQTSTTMDVVFGGVAAAPGTAPGNALSNNHPNNNIGGGGMTFATQGSMTFHLQGNTMRDANGSAITLQKASAGTLLNGFIDNNIIGVAGVTDSGSKTGNGVFCSYAGTGTASVTIANNTIHQIHGNAHIFADNTGGSYTANFDIQSNTLDTPGSGWFAGIAITNGSPSSTDTVNVCAVIGGSSAAQKNTLNLSGGLGVIVGSSGQNGGHTFNLPGFPGPSTQANVQNFIQGNNAGSFTTQAYADAPATFAAFTGSGTGCGTLTSSIPLALNPSSVSTADDAQSLQVGNRTDVENVLRAAAGDGPKDAAVPELTQEELAWMVQAAIRRWGEAGLSGDDIARLQVATFEISDLPEGQIASIDSNYVKLDATAAGYGWFFDQSPSEDSEFEVPVPGKELQTISLSPAHQRMDLLTVVMRELGIIHLQGTRRVPKQMRPLMESTLSPGVRRLPDPNLAQMQSPERSPARQTAGESGPENSFRAYSQAVAGAPSEPGNRKTASPSVFTPQSGETINLDLGTIPPGKNVTMMFQVTVNNSVPPGVSQVANQGTVSGSNFTTVLTDDPSTGTTTDPTVTTLCVPAVVLTPITNQQVAQGTTAIFTTTIQGSTPFTFVWKKNGTVLTSGVSLGGRATISTTTNAGAGTTTSTLTITGTILTDADMYTVDATDGCGVAVATESATLTVVEPPTVTKSFSPTSIPSGGVSQLTLTLTNPNASVTLTGVNFSDNLPAGLQVANPAGVGSTCSGTWNATPGDTTLNFGGGTLAPGTSCSLTVNITGTTPGAHNNTTNAPQSVEGGTGVVSNTATLTVIGAPTISKSFDASTIPLNGTSVLTLTITNPNTTTTLTGVAFTDTLPSGLTVPTGTSSTCGGGTLTTTAPDTIALTGGSIAPSSNCFITVTVTGSTAGVKNNTTGAVSSTNGGTGTTSNTATITVLAPPTISKAFGAASIPINGTTSLTFTLSNSNATVALTGVAFSDSLPSGLQVAATPGASTSCGGTFAPNAGDTTLTFSGGTLAAGGSCTVSVNVTGTTGGVKNNTTGAISSTNGGTGTTSNTATLAVGSPPTISKSFGAATVPLGTSTSLSFTITNPNATFGLTGVAFTDTLPAGLTVATGSATTCGGGTLTATAPGTITLSAASIAAAGNCMINVTVTGVAAGVWNNTTGAITSNEGGTGTTSNTATVTVVAPPTISKAFSGPTVALGGTTTVTFTINNPNPTVALTGVGFADALPAGLKVAGTPNANSSCGGSITAAAGSGSITFSGGTIAAAGSCTVSVDLTGVTAGVYDNTTGNVTSANGGTGATSNTATITVLAPPSISKSFSGTTVPIGQMTTLIFVLTNPNPTVALTGVSFVDVLPAGMIVANPPNASDGCGGTFAPSPGDTTLNFSGGTIAAGSSCTVSVGIQVTSAGIKSNTTGPISSANGGTGGSSNPATVSTFDICIQDDSDPSKVLMFDSTTGDYMFCCGTKHLVGKGIVSKRGCTVTLTQSGPNQRVSASVDRCQLKGTASIQFPIGVTLCSITDRNMANDTCTCVP